MIEIKRAIFIILYILCLSIVHVSAFDKSEFIPYINACSGIKEYSGSEKELNNLVVNVLNTHNNFRAMSSLLPDSVTTGSLKMCNADFIDDVIYKTFRIKTPRPSPHQFREVGYYYNNGFYYYNDNSISHSPRLTEITKIIPLDDGGVYVLFTDTLSYEDSPAIIENSAIKLYHDDLGLFVGEIHMGLDFSNLNEHLKTPEPTTPYRDFIWDILPTLVLVITIIAAITILYKFILF